MPDKRVRVTITVRTDPDRTFFAWALKLINQVHATAPGRVRFLVQVLPDEDVK